jgi:predicted Zn-dependent protease
VWDRMRKIAGASATPAFLSTHPDHEKRQSNLSSWMRSAQKRYKRSQQVDRSTDTLWTP